VPSTSLITKGRLGFIIKKAILGTFQTAFNKTMGIPLPGQFAETNIHAVKISELEQMMKAVNITDYEKTILHTKIQEQTARKQAAEQEIITLFAEIDNALEEKPTRTTPTTGTERGREREREVNLRLLLEESYPLMVGMTPAEYNVVLQEIMGQNPYNALIGGAFGTLALYLAYNAKKIRSKKTPPCTTCGV
jgi:hypothetical protein